MIRIVVADDHAVMRHGLKLLVGAQSDMEIVAEVADGLAVESTVSEAHCHVLVLDLSLPGLPGGEIVTRVRATSPRVGIVVLTMYPEDQLALHLLRKGALSYMSKTRDPEELLTAIRKASQGRRHITDTLAELALVAPVSEKPPHELLTPREGQVFQRLVEGKTVSEIAGELDVSASTISNHTAAIRDKLGVESVQGIVHYAYRMGLVGQF